MARLAMPPTNGATHHLSPPPLSSHTSDDDDADAATQQLLAESLVSASKPPPSSAVLGANLLNAARIHSSPAGMARKAGAGRLKRPSILAEGQPRKNLARRGNMYDILSSPEKGTFKLPETVNHQPLKVVKKQRRRLRDAGEDQSETHKLSSELPAPREEAANGEEGSGGPEATSRELANGNQSHSPESEPQLPSSPPEYVPNSVNQVEIEEHLPNGRRQCSAIVRIEKVKGKAVPIHRQCLREGPQMLDGEPRCARHVSRLPRLEEDAGMRSRPRLKRKSKDNLDNGGRPSKSARTQAQRGSRTEHESYGQLESHQKQDTNASTRKTQPQVQIPIRKRSRQKTKNDDVAANPPHNTQQEKGSATIDGAPSEFATEGTSTRTQRQASKGATSRDQHQPAGKQRTRNAAKAPNQAPSPDIGSAADASAISEADDGSSDANEPSTQTVGVERPQHLGDADGDGEIGKVFKFLDFEERPGKCQTELGITIKRTCEKSCVLVQAHDTSIDGIIEDLEDNRNVLNQICGVISEDDRRAFKSDAYHYIFRALTSYLEAVYGWFDESCDIVTGSLEAMRTLSSLLHEILAFKDTISKWGVSVPQRYKGDRAIKDVDFNLIVPLRRVDESFRVQLSQLEAAERCRHDHAELQRQQKEHADEERRRAETLVARRERWRRWQNLHISRMQCEPDPIKRKKLVITKLEDLEERDANGVKFERLPLFKTRSTPPLHRASATFGDREWTAEEETALLEGLERFAGPRAYEKIFSAYCRPGGELRDVSVTDIVKKSAWVCSAWLKLHQEKNWEVPEWVKRIPVLL